MVYNNKWTPEFPASVGNALRPTDPIDNTADYQTDGFPQFIANDPVRYDLQNAVLKQVLSNDERLNEKISVTNLAHNTDPKAHATGIAGNAATATKLAAQRNIALTGDATGSVSFDGSGDANINATLATVPIAKGGTGAITPAGALVNFDLTATATELNYVDGVTSSVQTQLNAKAPIASPTFTGTVTAPNFNGNLNGNANTVGGASLSQLVRADISQNMSDGISHRYPKNGGWMLVGGLRSDGGDVSCVTTDGTNLVLDSKNAGDIYLGYYGGKNVNFCGGSNSIKSHVDANGVFQGTANNSNYVAGLAVSGGRNNVGNQVVRTDGNGYLQTGYINSSNGDEGNNSNPARVWGTNGSDSYLRTYLTSALSVHQSSYTENVANDNTYMRFHWAGQGGQPTWLWGGSDASNMYVYNPSNFSVNYANSSGNVNGYSADGLARRLSGRNAPVITPLVDWSTMAAKAGVANVRNLNNAGSGISAYGGDYGALHNGDIYLTQSYRNFDAVLIYACNDSSDYAIWTKWESWELEVAFNQSYRFDLLKGGRFAYWSTWCYNKATANHTVSSPTYWACQEQGSGIIEIYGLTY